MDDRLTLVLAQTDQSVGDVSGNVGSMIAARAAARDADLIVAPELNLIGYPMEDLALKPAFVEAAEAGLQRLVEVTASTAGPAVLVGAPWRQDGRLFNAVHLVADGAVQGVRCKHNLPNYGVFDEKRWFDPGPLPDPISFRGIKIGVLICEDMWDSRVCAHLASRGTDFFVSPNGSPYETTKAATRLDKAMERVAQTGVPLAMVNRVGGQDELVFDGASFVVNPEGMAYRAPAWEERNDRTFWRRDSRGWRCLNGEIYPSEEPLESIYHAMVVGLRDYVRRNGFPGVVIGFSGGIDSALSAAVAVDALGAHRVRAVMMPTRYTSRASMEDAALCAAWLSVSLNEAIIAPIVATFERVLDPLIGNLPPDVTEENLQARIRGVALMALSNKTGAMLLTTGNKSEMAVGYATLYGDMCGGYSVLKDVYKTTVFALAHWRNGYHAPWMLGPVGRVIPQSIIDKPPSAELRSNQRDDDSLPPYDILDAILEGLIDREESVGDLAQAGFDRTLVAEIEKMVYASEHKRRQAPPGVKITSRAFGRDRRYPISHSFRTASLK